MTFSEALDYLYQANDFGIRPGLQRIIKLLELLGNPQENYPCIHIAGTNGKGSVSAYCAHVAAVTNKKVGWFTSPYLENFNERIRILDGRAGLQAFEEHFRNPEISDADFADLMAEVKAAIDQMLAGSYDHPTVFEILTAIAYLYYAREQVDLAVIEVGMGGRLDSTNVLTKPLATVITALGYDHMDRLGNSLGEIAGEKAGIIKAGCHVILYDPRDIIETAKEGEEALRVVQAKAQQLSAPLTLVSHSDFAYQEANRQGQAFMLQGSDRLWKIQLRGNYQRMNASLAIAACRSFAGEEEIAEGLARTRWPGRLEVMRQDPLLLIDGAHNVQGCAALAREIADHFDTESHIYLVGMLADKEHDKMLSLVLKGAPKPPTTVYCTECPVPRTMQARDLAEELQGILGWPADRLVNLEETVQSPGQEDLQDRSGKICYSPHREETLLAALAQAQRDHKGLVIFGSLYLIGNLRPYVRRELWGQAIDNE